MLLLVSHSQVKKMTAPEVPDRGQPLNIISYFLFDSMDFGWIWRDVDVLYDEGSYVVNNITKDNVAHFYHFRQIIQRPVHS